MDEYTDNDRNADEAYERRMVRDARESESVEALHEQQAPQGSLRCDGVVGLPDLSSNDEDILSHTSRNGRYVTDEADAADLARRGLLYDHGAQKLAGGMHYYTISAEGRAALRAHRLAARPIPRQPEPNGGDVERRGQ